MSIVNASLDRRQPQGLGPFYDDVCRGLRQDPKRLPSKYFYDQRGSRLFDEICGLPEYYLTRTELAIMQHHADGIVDALGPRALIVEYGSGSSTKTRILLDRLADPAAYVPIDISREHLLHTARHLARGYPRLEILPLCADFTRPLVLPRPRRRPARTVVYFPGSTLGNFSPAGARRMLRSMVRTSGPGGGLLVGIDLAHDPRLHRAAYNDRAGVTARFNLNLLARINRELSGDFQLERFRHRAVYNAGRGRIEMYLDSRCRQLVTIADCRFGLAAGEPICTEYSYKYTVPQFAALAAASGLRLRTAWQDDRGRFAVVYLEVAGE